jgi:hypothetical protein
MQRVKDWSEEDLREHLQSVRDSLTMDAIRFIVDRHIEEARQTAVFSPNASDGERAWQCGYAAGVESTIGNIMSYVSPSDQSDLQQS